MAKGRVVQFDLKNSLTRKEARTIRKCQGMEQYWLARCPHRGVYESKEYAKSTELKKKVLEIEAKAKKRWEGGF